MIDLYFTLIEQQSDRRAMHEAQHRAGRRLLCEALGCNEDAVRYHKNGKPYVPGGPFFNISHSGCMVLLAVSEEGEIGCDVEDMSVPVRNEEAIRKKIAKPGEENTPLLELWVKFEAEQKAGEPGTLCFPYLTEGYVAAVCAKFPGEVAITQKYFGK